MTKSLNRQIPKSAIEQFEENDRLDLIDQLEGWKKRATAGEDNQFDLLTKEEEDDKNEEFEYWIRIDHPSRFPGWEYVYLLDNGKQIIGTEQLPGRIYYAAGVWYPLDRFTHFAELMELPAREVLEEKGGEDA